MLKKVLQLIIHGTFIVYLLKYQDIIFSFFNKKQIAFLYLVILFYFIGVIITILFFYIFFNIKIKFSHQVFTLNVSLLEIIGVIEEELFWRHLLFYLFKKYLCLNAVWFTLLSSALFVSSHSKLSKDNFLESYIYSILITISFILFPFTNIGLHIGRNSVINKLLKLRT